MQSQIKTVKETVKTLCGCLFRTAPIRVHLWFQRSL